MVSGCLCAGKITQKLNHILVIAVSLLATAMCLFAAPFCGNLVTLSVTMAIHGVFSGLLTVGKPRERLFSFICAIQMFSYNP